MILEFNSDKFGDHIRELRIGQEVNLHVRGRVTKIEAEMIDVSTHDLQDALHGDVTVAILVTGMGAPQ